VGLASTLDHLSLPTSPTELVPAHLSGRDLKMLHRLLRLAYPSRQNSEPLAESLETTDTHTSRYCQPSLVSTPLNLRAGWCVHVSSRSPRTTPPPSMPRSSQPSKFKVAHYPKFFAVDESAPASYHLSHQPALRSRPWISCRVAEGRALRRHGNRTGIIYRGRQVPTLDPETGDMRFGMRA